MWNCMNGSVNCFIADELDTKDLMLDILGMLNTKKDDTRQLSSYTNQWRFRSTRVVVHDSVFNFNKGSLTYNEIFQQFMNSLIFYKVLGVTVCGFICDGGGSNEIIIHKIVDHFNM